MLGNPGPECRRNQTHVLVLYLVDPVIVGVYVYNEMLVYLFSYLLLDLRTPDRLEAQLGRLGSLDLVQDARYYLREVQVDQPGRRHADPVARVGLLELDLVVVQQAGRLIPAPDVDQDIAGLPDLRVPATDHLGVLELADVVEEHRAGQDLVAVEPAVVSADFEGLHGLAKAEIIIVWQV